MPAPDRFEARLARVLPFVTAACFAVMLLSLQFGFLDRFFVTTWHGRLAFDYFSVPRAFVNLCRGVSVFATPDGQYGPYASWYPYHPALAVWLGGPLSLFKPWTGYAAFVALSGTLLYFCARLLGRFTDNPAARQAGYFILMCSPAAYLMLWCGQMHVFTVVSAALIMADLLDLLLVKTARWNWRIGRYELRPVLLAGLLLSLFSKPVLLLILPALFAVPGYRATLLGGGAVYALVSVLFVLLPRLNPQGIGFDGLVSALLDPKTLFRPEKSGDIVFYTYKMEFVRDNAIHWLNMKSRSGFFEPEHMEFFSLSAFLAHLAGRPLSQRVYMLPVYLMLVLSGGCYFIKNAEKRLACVITVCALGLLGFYTSYAVVYEYHFVTLMPVLAAMLGLGYSRRGRAAFGVYGPAVFCAGGALLFAPTSYYWFLNPAYGFHRPELALLSPVYIPVFLSGGVYDWALDYIRVLRAVAVAGMLAGLLIAARHTFAEGFKKEFYE
ncbi:MAG: hypothetical protein PHW69_02445 [Elusimicrobiaceae bacterium]|nr:hypothetical protein [Elusimicrobiaceae bacterium]